MSAKEIDPAKTADQQPGATPPGQARRPDPSEPSSDSDGAQSDEGGDSDVAPPT